MSINHHIYKIKPNQCVCCEKIKLYNDFYHYTNKKNKNNHTCKKCYTKKATEWRKKNPERYKLMKRKSDKKRRSMPGYKEKQSKYFKEWYKKNK